MGGGGQNPSVAVETTTTLDRKVAALLCHKSQIGDPRPGLRGVSDGAAGPAAAPAGLPEGGGRALPGHPDPLTVPGPGAPRFWSSTWP